MRGDMIDSGNMITPAPKNDCHSYRARDSMIVSFAAVHEFTTDEVCTHYTIDDRQSPTLFREAAMGAIARGLYPLKFYAARSVLCGELGIASGRASQSFWVPSWRLRITAYAVCVAIAVSVEQNTSSEQAVVDYNIGWSKRSIWNRDQLVA